MISERKFASSYTSFWNHLLPRVDGYLRRVNCSCERYSDETPVLASTHRDRRGIVNELAFRLFQATCAKGNLSGVDVRGIAEEVRQYVERLSKANDAVVKEPVAQAEITEATALCASLQMYFEGIPFAELVFWPQFAGCGILDAVKGDIIHDRCLYEVKAGDRSFRVTDIRQVLIYCAMDFAADRFGVKHVVLLNPRRGTHFRTSVEDMVRETAGCSAVEFCGNIVEFLSSENTSR